MQADCWEMCKFFECAGLHLVAVIIGCVGCLHGWGSSPNANIMFLNCVFHKTCEKKLEQLLLPSFCMLRSREAELEGTSGHPLVDRHPKLGSPFWTFCQHSLIFELEARNQEVLMLCFGTFEKKNYFSFIGESVKQRCNPGYFTVTPENCLFCCYFWKNVSANGVGPEVSNH